jgi:hypothetical protein
MLEHPAPSILSNDRAKLPLAIPPSPTSLAPVKYLSIDIDKAKKRIILNILYIFFPSKLLKLTISRLRLKLNTGKNNIKRIPIPKDSIMHRTSPTSDPVNKGSMLNLVVTAGSPEKRTNSRGRPNPRWRITNPKTPIENLTRLFIKKHQGNINVRRANSISKEKFICCELSTENLRTAAQE